MGLGNTIISIGGLVAVIGVTWYLYSKGYFDTIVEAIPKLPEPKSSNLAYRVVAQQGPFTVYKTYPV